MKKEEIKTEEDIIHFLSDRTEFEREVLVATFKIPKGKVSTYKRIAEKVGRPRAYRAVGNTLHKNPLAPLVHVTVLLDPMAASEERKKELNQEGSS